MRRLAARKLESLLCGGVHLGTLNGLHSLNVPDQDTNLSWRHVRQLAERKAKSTSHVCHTEACDCGHRNSTDQTQLVSGRSFPLDQNRACDQKHSCGGEDDGREVVSQFRSELRKRQHENGTNNRERLHNLDVFAIKVVRLSKQVTMSVVWSVSKHDCEHNQVALGHILHKSVSTRSFGDRGEGSKHRVDFPHDCPKLIGSVLT